MNTIARRRISIGSVLWLTAVWVLLWGAPDPLTVVGGAAVAALVLLLFPLPRVQVRFVVRPLATMVLMGRFLYDLVVASLEVSWLAIRHGPTTRGAVMDIELAGDEELLQTITAEMVALVPGTVVIDLEPHERLLTLHALDVTTLRQAQMVRRRVLAQEARVLRAFHPDPNSVLDPRRRPPVPALAQVQSDETVGGVRDSLRDATTEEER
ncbi:hypothetical protein GCM10009584_31470 [Ornithinimicrobium humiphilum]|uniref:Multisubunit sodium/proton antiporter MrpE subunit n=1 Tax=Ornithinimicrobium humiphilum TaxID=125288 RepID=A0A543K5D9_9MICO|nr:Na+/H+ antiporter subunit E [Ornithinimicrobium humiphilum]TQM90289.1 multisubunit sodium/proton antiporter MrpE subunit [Ornithinimicrobium humiphilum]